MAKGFLLTGPEAQRVKRSVERTEADGRFVHRPAPVRKRYPPGESAIQVKTVILDGALAAASNALNSPATATASVYVDDGAGDLEDSADNITVTNRFTEVATIASGTLMVVMKIGTEWWPIVTDCGATTIA